MLERLFNAFERFGYDIDSTILHSLALEGDGTFSFIPDSSMVGTVFINTIANSLISTSNNAKVSLFPEKDTKVVEYGHSKLIREVNAAIIGSWVCYQPLSKQIDSLSI